MENRILFLFFLCIALLTSCREKTEEEAPYGHYSPNGKKTDAEPIFWTPSDRLEVPKPTFIPSRSYPWEKEDPK